MKRRLFLGMSLISATRLAFAAKETKPRCSVCGMYVVNRPPHAFLGTRNGKPSSFCSFSCALAYRRKNPAGELRTFASGSGHELSADEAFYVIHSEKLASKFKFAMAPVVIAFASETEAKKARGEANEGEVVKGFAELIRALDR